MRQFQWPRLYAETVGSNPAHGMVVCHRHYYHSLVTLSSTLYSLITEKASTNKYQKYLLILLKEVIVACSENHT
jgi:hypothetical protein